jgi:predicted Zn-dependent protease with MMP-like domain
MDNVDIVVEDRPHYHHLAASRVSPGETLLGLYQGVPLTSRGSAYGMVLPDKITIFQRPIEAMCETPEEIEEKVRQVVLHEVAHHFGMDEAALAERGVG